MVAAQTVVAGLDLAAVLLVGLVVAGASSVVLGEDRGTGAAGLASWAPTTMDGIAWLSALAGCLLLIKSVLSLHLTRRTYRFLANRAAIVSSGLARDLLSLPLQDVQRRSSQEISQALTIGVNVATVNTLGPLSTLVSECALAALLILGLAVVDVSVAIFTVAFFGIVAFALQLALGRWAQRLGEAQVAADVGSVTEIQHALKAYRELVVTNRRSLFVERFEFLRWKSAAVQADTFILSQSGKYVFEAALVFGAASLILILATTRSIESALLALTVFLLVATRIFPSILRIQNAFTLLRNSQGMTVQLFGLINDLKQTRTLPELNLFPGIPSGPFTPKVHLSDVTVLYNDSRTAALTAVNLVIEPGCSVAVTGPTGAGKSTLADVILGVLRPTEGTVRISGKSPQEACALWPGKMSYVPQDVAVLTGTVRENVALGIPSNLIDDSDVLEALRRAHLDRFLDSYRNGLDTLVGEHGVKLSGGQRQRLGIARALYTHPALLVLDEATSALDAATELSVSNTIEELAGDVTTIIVAHRLATVRSCDLVVYLSHGHIVATGSFEHVRQSVPDFDRQAGLMGL